MKQISLIEMDGFLKGKCIPSGLKVNETDAEYLVHKFAEAEAKCMALTTEDAGLKSGAMDEIKVINRGGQAYYVRDEVQANPMYARGWDDYRAKSLQLDIPATDAFLAEVRAQDMEMLYASRAAQWADELLVELNEFATQLREGGAA